MSRALKLLEQFELVIGTRVAIRYSPGDKLSGYRGAVTKVLDNDKYEISLDSGSPIIKTRSQIVKLDA